MESDTKNSLVPATTLSSNSPAVPVPWSLTTEPKSWQAAAFERWANNQRGIVEAVTGAGKTVLAEMCIAWFHHCNPDGRIIVLIPTLALADQWYVSLLEDLNLPPTSVSIYSGESRPQRPTSLNIMVLNTARRLAPLIAQQATTMLVVDECHRAASKHNSRALRANYAATLGISATPKRQNDDLFDTVLVPTLGPILFEYTYTQAVQDGVIVPFDLFNVAGDFSDGEMIRYNRATARVARLFNLYNNGEVTSDTLRQALMQRSRISATASNRLPIAARIAAKHRRERTLVFHESVKSADHLVTILNSQGLNAVAYHSRISPTVRRDNLRLFRRGMFDVLVTCRALDEGLNVPETSVAIVASSTASLRQRIQRLGRVLRPAEGKTEATIYTVYMTETEERRLAKEAATLRDVANVYWLRSEVAKYGSSACQR